MYLNTGRVGLPGLFAYNDIVFAGIVLSGMKQHCGFMSCGKSSLMPYNE